MQRYHIPLLQTKDVLPLTTLGHERPNLEPARSSVLTAPVRRANRVPDDILSAGGSGQFRLSGQAACDDHAGDGARRGAAEGAGGAGGGAGEAQGWAEGGEGRHCWGCVEIWRDGCCGLVVDGMDAWWSGELVARGGLTLRVGSCDWLIGGFGRLIDPMLL